MGGFSKNLVGGWGGKLAIPGLRPCGGDLQISWNRNGAKCWKYETQRASRDRSPKKKQLG